MQTPFSVRPLLADERAILETGLRSASAFPLRRCQILRARAAGQVTTTMAHDLRCTAQTVRTALPAFPPARARGAAAAIVPPPYHRDHWRCGHLRGLAGTVPPESPDRRHAHQPVDPPVGRRGPLRPRADAAARQRRSDAGSPAPVGRALAARPTWEHQSRSGLSPQKKRRDRLRARARTPPPGALGFGDAVWWRRLAQPNQPGWTDTEGTPKLQALPPATEDTEPTALACDGRLVRPEPPQANQRWRRVVAGRPGRAVTRDGLAWCSAQRAAPGCTALRLLWDNASWHRSHAGRPWVRQPKQQVKQGGAGGRIVVCHLPSQSPWLNPMAPPWGHGKRAVSEPDRLLRAAALEARVYAYYDCECAEHLIMPKKVA